jgi:hypothetical protein
MLLQEVSVSRESLLRTACEEIGYDPSLTTLAPYGNEIMDAAIAFMKDWCQDTGKVSLHRSGSYPYNLRQLWNAHETYKTAHALSSRYWTTPVVRHLDQYGFSQLPSIKDWYEMDRYTGKVPRRQIRTYAAKLSSAIEYIDLLRSAAQGVFGQDPYHLSVAKATLKKLGVPCD